MDLLEADDNNQNDDSNQDEKIETAYNAEKTHDIWEDSSNNHFHYLLWEYPSLLFSLAYLLLAIIMKVPVIKPRIK